MIERETLAVESYQRWLAFLGTPDCPCPTRCGPLGVLYGVSMGHGWIRTGTDPKCPYHGVFTAAEVTQ